MTRTLTVAVVDDEASVRKALNRVLSASHISTHTYESGQQFLDSLASHKPDCVLLDLHMPGMSGHEVQSALGRVAASVPVIIITAFDDAEARTKCMTAGACAYLLKPLDEQVLLNAIATCTTPSAQP
ncbi:MAG TPA: response regulator [Verrucomicrobiae bacterium]|nr:response regulator [Verrucomicrobiae bacterium]